jgi:hypothetical protein
MDKGVYVVNETSVIKVNRTQDVNITCVVANKTDSVQADNFTIENDGNLGLTEYYYGQTLGTGEYTLTLTQGAENVEINFEVASEILKPFARLMGSATPVFVNTSTGINNVSGGVGGNFSELLKLNKSATLHYGYAVNLTGDGKTFHFVVLDGRTAGVYDDVYVDDDRNFQLYNDTEDNSTQPFLETSKKPGEMLSIDSNNRFIIADVESSTGRMVYLIRPLASAAFSSSGTLHMIVFVTNGSGNIQKDKVVNVSIQDESKASVYSNLVTIGSDGYVNLSVNLSEYAPGKYAILVNQTAVDFFRVETYSLNGKITDLSDNPSSSFAPGSKAKVWVVARDTGGNLVSLSSIPAGTITLPSGATSSLSFSLGTNATGVYTAESPSLTQTGEYKVVISGIYGSYTERFDMGFKVQSIEMTIMTLNPKYIDEGPGQGAMIAAFAPNSNITAAVFMINATKGSGLKTGGPPCGFDGESCVRVSCDASQFGVTVKDELGNRYKLSSQNFTSMTIGEAVAFMEMEEGPQEPGMNDQCMIFMWGRNNTWLNKTGNYKLEVKFSNSSVGIFENGQTFSVQRLLATGSTVDFKGDSFSFLAPNSTVRVKLEIRDIATDELLSAGSILNAKFTSMWKEWPERKNAFSEMSGFSKTLLNESVQNATIVFNSPPEEGFYSAEFRFQANLSGETAEGTGTIFFELKKYMIWAQLSSMSQGNWYVKAGQNITLTVNVMDIDMGSQYGSESLEKSCTGCAGLIANVSALRNEQFFREMVEGVDYTVTTGVLINSTSGATIVINPIGGKLTPGWYGIDVILQRPGTSEAYYGWGGFEIRNFWVDVFEASYNETSGNYTRAGQGGPSQGGTTVAKGGSVILGVVAYEPPTPMSPPYPIQITGVTVEGLQNSNVWPPLSVASSEYSAAAATGEMQECYGPGQCMTVPIYVVNFSAAETIKESDYMLSMRIESGAGSDIGSAMITVSSYVADYQSVPQSKMFEYPPVYATSENVSMLFSTSDFGQNPVNITNITVKNVYSEMEGRPLKFRFGQNYTNNCTGADSSCRIDAFLSGLSSGGYMIEFEVNSSGSLQTVQYKFEVKNFIFSVPKIYEGWTNDYATPDKTLDANNGEDTCDAELHLQWWDQCWSETDKACTDNMGGNQTNVTLPAGAKNVSSQYFVDRMCIRVNDGGRWQSASSAMDQCPDNKFVFIVMNSTNAWIGSSTDLSSSGMLTNGSVFELPDYAGLNWTINSFRQGEPNYARIKHYGAICSRDNSQFGGIIKIVPPAGHANYSTFYHGPGYIVGDMWNQEDCGQNPYSVRCKFDIADKPVYAYHNTTHLWLYPNSTYANFTDSSLTQGPVAVGGIINDGSGGQWKIVSISKSKISLKGVNILSNGIMVNTSLSTSGNVRIGELREVELGFENKMAGSKEGIDLDGDGYTNSTVMFLILDSGVGYDKLAFYNNFTKKWNITNVIDVNNLNRSQRQIGVGQSKLTLLSIDPRANSVKFYDPMATGDWPELGDSRAGSNVTIPVIIKSPDGSRVPANVSIPNMKIKTSASTTIVPTGLSPIFMNGSGEIRINVSALGYGSGRYEFEIRARSGANEEKLNEWMWPRTTVRDFLVDSYSGYGGIASGFVAMNIRSYGGWESQSRIRQLFTINQTGSPEVRGVMEAIQHYVDPPSCPQFVKPSNAGSHTHNGTFLLDRLDGQYFAYLTDANQTIMWLKSGDCNFTGQYNYSAGSPVNITLGSDRYMLYVLNANISSNLASIGLAGFSDGIQPIRMNDWGGNPSPTWAVLSLNRSNTIYNVVFANDTDLSYPQAGTWGVQEVSKVVWIDTDGNFSGASKYTIGQNFTASEYVARMGPGPWEGIVIADSSNLSSIGINVNPGLDAKARDGTPSYFGKINESDPAMGLDLNLDGDMEDIFYVASFDDFDDGLQQLTRIYVDDDLNITEPWWANSSNIQEGGSYMYYDFYGDEQGIPEQDGSIPKGMWGGSARFAPRNQSQSWEQSAEWNVKSYNGTKMILEKNVWNMNANKTISLTLKVFDFSQAPLSGAQISLVKLMRFGGGQPFVELNVSQNFSVTKVQNVTDGNGYAMLKLVPPSGGWLNGAEYIATLQVVHDGKTEIMDNWFRMGQQGGGG